MTPRPDTTPKSVAHLIPSLATGGAEMLLVRLVDGLNDLGIKSTIYTLQDVGNPLEPRCETRSLRLSSRLAAVFAPRRLRAHWENEHPDVVHTWMPHAGLLGGWAAHRPRIPVVWSFHNTRLPLGGVPFTTWAITRGSRYVVQRLADEVVCTSEATYRELRSQGYPDDRLSVIVNPPPRPTRGLGGSSTALRAELSLPTDTILVGIVARFARQKDHLTFVKAMSRVCAAAPNVHVIMIGRGVDATNAELAELVLRHLPSARTHLLGERADAPELIGGLDLLVSSSAFGETSPLVLSEALTQGVPVVTTDVGDCAALVGKAGLVVPPRDHPQLASAVLDLVRNPTLRSEMGREGRRRVGSKWSLEAAAAHYVGAYERAIHHASSSRVHVC